jgi:GntR family transcriptional regulator
MLVSVDEKDPRPLYQQIAAQVKDQVQRGNLQPGDELPSVRELAESLGINLHTVRSAYLKLRDQDVIDLRLGRRARIAHAKAQRPTLLEAERTLGTQVRDLVADAFILGLSSEDLHALLDRHYGHSGQNRAGHSTHSEDGQ